MATVAPTTDAASGSLTLIQPGQRLFTAADLVAMPTRLPSGDVSFELHHGRLVAVSPPGAAHGFLQNLIANALTTLGQMKGVGRAYTEVGIVLDRNPDHIVGADNAFITSRSLPAREAPEGYLETIPQLVVEVRSKNDTVTEIATKVTDYLNAGVQLVWVVDSDTDTVTEHRPNSKPKVYHKADSLTCEDIIPGFRLPLAELFKD
jgi:Uma2 family endonuclease